MSLLCDSLWGKDPEDSALSNATQEPWSPLTNAPSLSRCIQDTGLVWCPVGYLVLALPFYIKSKWDSPLGVIQRSRLNIFKQILAFCSLCTCLIELVWLLLNGLQDNGVSLEWYSILAPTLQAVAMILVMCIMEYERRKGVRSSVFVLLFWILVTLAGFFILWSQGVVKAWTTDKIHWETCCVFYGLALLQMVLSMLVDKQPKGGKVSMDQFVNPSPMYYVSSVTKLFIWHAFSIVRYAFKNTLKLKDIWDLTPDFLAENQRAILESYWMQELDRSYRSGIKRKFQKDQNKVDPESGIPLLEEEPYGIHDHYGKEENLTKDKSQNVKDCYKNKYQPSLLKAILKTFGGYYLIGIGFRLIIEVFVFINPLILRKIIHFIENEEESMWNGYLYALSMFLFSLTQALLQNHMVFVQFTTNIRIRNSVMSAVYNKALKLSASARKDSTVGEIVNLMAVDAMKYNELLHYINMIWVFPVQVGVALYFLFGLLGPSALAGLAVFALKAPMNFVIGRITKRLQARQMKQKDQRIKLTNEVFSGIKVLKLYAWELSFESQIQAIRKRELTLLKYLGFLASALHFIFAIAPFMIALVSFAVYVLSSPDNILTAEKAFVSLAYFNILRTPLQQLPTIINNMITCHVSHSRIYRFLLKEELDPESVIRESYKSDNCVEMNNGNFGWDPEGKPLLQSINMEVKPGKMVAIVGSVGAGKSSLLSAYMGEMHKFSGTVKTLGSIAYVPQQAWIQQATLESNVLFGKEMEQKRYEEVIEVCALLPDLEILPGGDQTEIGEKGINLSGGQKLRVSLARAVYQQADVYFLDDPLSAVDAHVGKNIFEKVLGPNGMLKDKTRLIVTHALWFLPYVDEIYVMENGCVKEHGSFKELMAKNEALAELMHSYEATKGSVTDACNEKQEPDVVPQHKERADNSSRGQLDEKYSFERVNRPSEFQSVPDLHREHSPQRKQHGKAEASNTRARTLSAGSHENQRRKDSVRHQLLQRQISNKSVPNDMVDQSSKASEPLSASQYDLTEFASQLSLPSGLILEEMDLNDEFEGKLQEEETMKTDMINERENNKKAKGELVEEEKVEKGKVKMSVYIAYFKAIGLAPGLSVIFLAIGSKVFDLEASFWLSKWSDDMGKLERGSLYNDTYSQNDTETTFFTSDHVNQGYYLGIFATLGFCQAFTAALRHAVGILAGLRTSKAQHNILLRTVLRSPMEFFDRTPLGRVLNRFSGDMSVIDETMPHLLLGLMSQIFEVIGSVAVIGVITPWSLIAWVVLGIIFITVQVFYVSTQRQGQRILSTCKSPVYAHFAESLSGMSTIRAYGLQNAFLTECQNRVNQWGRCSYFHMSANRWLGVTLNLIGCSIVFMAAIMNVSFRHVLTAGLVGLGLSYALTITNHLTMLVRQSALVESNIVSVERVIQYVDLPEEAPWENEKNKPPASWPEEGQVVLDQLSNRYREGLDLVLKGISCHIQPAEKIGIVGRTGAGKTSLTLSLFRIIEAAKGRIVIDGVDVSTLGLHDLRSKLTVIPQDPVLFSGPLRMNLDPFNVHTDNQVWGALKQAHLADWIRSLDAGLHHDCSEGGENLSIGQRQLVCLARALLRKTKVLILDEATAACDVETDDLIQSTIRTEFAECTVLTVAHRLNTIMDYDRIMVLGEGRILEMDTPKNLLADQKSVFYSMAKDAGLFE